MGGCRYNIGLAVKNSAAKRRVALLWRLENYGLVAQSVEQRTENPCVGGSIPPQATKNCVVLIDSGHCRVWREVQIRYINKSHFSPKYDCVS